MHIRVCGLRDIFWYEIHLLKWYIYLKLSFFPFFIWLPLKIFTWILIFQYLVKHEGNVTFEEILSIARQMRGSSMANKLSGTVKEILGTAQSVGCKVDGQHPHAIIDKVNSGEYPVPEK